MSKANPKQSVVQSRRKATAKKREVQSAADGRHLACLCGRNDGAVRRVRMRVPGTATLYSQNVVVLCETCRSRNKGSFMYWDRRP